MIPKNGKRLVKNSLTGIDSDDHDCARQGGERSLRGKRVRGCPLKKGRGRGAPPWWSGLVVVGAEELLLDPVGALFREELLGFEGEGVGEPADQGLAILAGVDELNEVVVLVDELVYELTHRGPPSW